MIWLRDATVRRYAVARARRFGRLAWAALLVALVLVPFFFTAGAGLLLLAIGLGVAAAAARSPATVTSGRLKVDRSSVLSEDGTVIFTKEEVARGVVTSSGLGAQAELTLKDGREMHVGAWTWAEAEAVLAELGLDASARRTQLDLTGDSRTVVGLLLAYFACIPLGGIAVVAFAESPIFFSAFAALAVLTFMGMGALTRPPVVEIGADIVIVRRPWGARSVPLRDIADVTCDGMGIRLVRREGKPVVIGGMGSAPQAVRAAAARIRQALSAFRGAAAPRTVLDLLGRRGRDLATWRRDLGAAVEHAGDYRTRSLEATDIAQALESADATPTERAGAAMLLSGHPDPELRARVRIAVDRAASPRLRVALERIVELADEPTIEAALAEAEAEHAQQVGGRR